MSRFFIRCDASLLIGSGHVMRCRTLARELQRRGSEVFFLCRRQPGDLISMLQQEFQALPLPEQASMDCTGLEGRDLYKAWLGCSQSTDAAHTLKLLADVINITPSWLVVDHYGLDAAWEEQVRDGLSGRVSSVRLFVIDDLADRYHQADLLLDQNFFGESTQQRYQYLVTAGCHCLLGPQHALLSSEYAQLHELVPPRSEILRVFIFFGGVDVENFTGRALKAMMDPAFKNIVIDVVLGSQSSHYEMVKNLVDKRPLTTLHAPLPGLAGLISRADLSIGGVGATTWERACLGLPSISIAIAENQIRVSQELADHGFIRLVPFDSDTLIEDLRHNLHYFAADSNLYNASVRSKTLTMGLGARNCTDHLLNL